MRRLNTLAAAIALGMAVLPASAVQAQSRQPGQQQEQCPKGQRVCATSGKADARKSDAQGAGRPGAVKQAEAQAHAAPTPKSQMKPAAPRAGDRISGGKPFQRASNSRFKAPPQGQEYRVVNDYLVLMDSRTLQAVTVLGLLDALSK